MRPRLLDSPNQGRFTPGQTAWNKGIKGSIRPNRTSFQCGHGGTRTVPVGTIRQRTFRGRVRNHIKVGPDYRFAQMAPLGWMEYAKYLWIETHGRLLDGDVVHHLNGDSLDDSIANLLAVPRSVHPTIHNRHWRKDPSPELVEACLVRYR